MSKPSELPTAIGDAHPPPNHFDTQELRTLSPDGGRQTELLVLSRDAGVIEVMRAAAPSVVKVISAGDIDEVADQPGLDPGVLVVDTAITNDVHAMLPQLLQHFPEIVIIVVGKRDDVSALMRLTAAGRIFRFLLIPLAHGQTRLALGSAVAHHLEIKAANVRTGAVPVMERKKFRYAYLAVGLGAVVAIAAIWFGVAALTHRDEVPTADQTVPPASLPPPLQAAPDAIQVQLQLAKEAFDQGNFNEPAGTSALDLYRKALALDPKNAEAQAGVRAVADKILSNAESALTSQRLADAVRGVEVARSIDAGNPRLQFLDNQLTRERERVKIDAEMERTNRVRRLLQQASADIVAQRYVRPQGSNARDALLEARKLDPSDPAITLAITQLATTLMEASRKSAAAGDMNSAKEFLDGARKLGASAATVAAVERSFTESRARETVASRSITPQVGATTPAPVETKSQQEIQGTSNPNVGATTATQSGPPPAAAPAPTASKSDQWLQAMDLPRTREVAPDYPSQAFINGTEGWVDVDFTITEEGVPDNLRVRDSSPRRVFDRAALDSVRQWRFVPIRDNGTPVARRATLRVRFQRQ